MADDEKQEQNFEREKFMIETQRNIHEKRRSLTFHILITTVTFYCACIAGMLSGKLDDLVMNSSPLPLWPFVVLIACIASAAIGSMIGFHVANGLALRKIVDPLEDRIRKSLNLEEQKPHKCGPYCLLLFHILIVEVGGIVVVFFFCLKF